MKLAAARAEPGAGGYESRIAQRYRYRGSRPARRPLAARHGALGLAHQDRAASRRSTPARACGSSPRTKRSVSSPAICAICCSPRPPARAPRSASIQAFAPASRSRSSTRPARSSPPPPSIRMSRSDDWDGALAHARPARPRAQGRADRHRQWHGLARDRQARRRTDRRKSRAEAHQDRGFGSRRLGLFRFANTPRANCPISMSRCAAPRRSRGVCKTRWPSW